MGLKIKMVLMAALIGMGSIASANVKSGTKPASKTKIEVMKKKRSITKTISSKKDPNHKGVTENCALIRKSQTTSWADDKLIEPVETKNSKSLDAKRVAKNSKRIQ